MRVSAAALLLMLSATRAPAQCRIVPSESPSYLGEAAIFSVQGCGSPGSSVAWDFGDDARDTLAGPASHAYAATGSYTVFARPPGQAFPVILQHSVLHRPTPSAPARSSTLIHDAARSRLWNVNSDNHSVTLLDAGTYARLAEIRVGRNPRTLALDTLGRLWVVNQDDASLSVLDGNTFASVRTVRLPYASRPYGIVFAPGGKTAYVTLQGTGRLLRLNALSFEVTGNLEVFPTPRGLAVSHDGSRILVTRFISPASHGEVALVDAAPFALAKVVTLVADRRVDSESNGAGVPNALSSVTISPDGRRAWVPFKKDNTNRGLFVNPARGAPTFESTVRTGVAQIDLAAGAEDTLTRVDLDNRSLASAVAFDRKGNFAYVATLASNHTAVYNNATGAPATAIEPVDLDRELGPDGLALDAQDGRLFVHYSISRDLGVYDVSGMNEGGESPRLARVRTVIQDSLPDLVLKGKRLFYNASDPRMSRDRYISCAVCHLDDGSDGRVWDFTHRGEGLRRTTSLMGRSGMDHGPVHWTANFDEIQDFEHDVREGFGGFGFLTNAEYASTGGPLGARKAGLSPDLDALAAYVSSLTRVNPSPYRDVSGALTADAVEGEKIFNGAAAGCAVCHAPPRYTDSRLATGVPFLLHDVGTLKAGSGKRLNDTLKGLDTPTLLGIWESGPYLHDGSAATLMDVLTTANPGDAHGKTSHLTAAQKNQLVAFLRQLDQGYEAPATLAARAPAPWGRLALRDAGGAYEILWDYPGAGRDASLRILDFRGRGVAHLKPMSKPVRPAASSGSAWAFRWERGASERALPSGAYLFRLEWDGGAVARRVFVPGR